MLSIILDGQIRWAEKEKGKLESFWQEGRKGKEGEGNEMEIVNESIDQDGNNSDQIQLESNSSSDIVKSEDDAESIWTGIWQFSTAEANTDLKFNYKVLSFPSLSIYLSII